jgi:hypothetical protein
VYAHRLTDTEQEAGITSDAQGRPCTFGPSHDECQYRFLEKIPGTPNNIDYHSGFKVGYSDGFNEGIYHHAKDNGGTASFSDGYTDGWLKGCVVGGGNSEDCNIQADANTP